MSTRDLHHARQHRSAFLFGLIFINLLLLMGCEGLGASTSTGSPLEVRASISPPPLVGQDVTWHIEMISYGFDLPDTKLKITLPDEVELVSGDSAWQGDLLAHSTAAVDLVIRVMTPGEWKISTSASAVIGPGSSATGWKTLYITSSETAAKVVEDIHWTGTPVPLLQFMPTFTPESTLTPNP